MEYNTYVLHWQLLFPELFTLDMQRDSSSWALHPPETACRGRAALSLPGGAQGQRSTWPWELHRSLAASQAQGPFKERWGAYR